MSIIQVTHRVLRPETYIGNITSTDPIILNVVERKWSRKIRRNSWNLVTEETNDLTSASNDTTNNMPWLESSNSDDPWIQWRYQ